ncbi:Accessory gene regulator protein A [Companilactobacillus paralimentarius]
MLMNIVICEDNEELRMYYQLIIKNYIKDHLNVDMKIILSTANPRDVDIYMENHINDIKFFLLDIEFPDSKIKGIDLATSIRKKDSKANIVFITTHEELTPMIFERKVEPLDYIAKEIGLKGIKEKLYRDLTLSFQTMGKTSTDKHKNFTFKIGPKKYNLNIEQIDYFESLENNHNIFVHSTSEIIEFTDTLRSVEKKSSNFYRAHKSLVVNLGNIKSIDTAHRELIFKDDSTCDISRRKLKILKQKLNNKTPYF